MKNPTIATLLNIIPGLGYIYLGRRRVFGILILTSIILGCISSFDPRYNAIYNEASEFLIWDLFSLLALAMTVPAFMLDAYNEAMSMQKANS